MLSTFDQLKSFFRIQAAGVGTFSGELRCGCGVGDA